MLYKTVFPYPQNGSIETHPTYITHLLYSSDKMMHEAVLLREKACWQSAMIVNQKKKNKQKSD